MQAVRVHHYSVAPADFEAFLERRTKVIDAIRIDHPGLSEALLIKLEDGTFTDIWRWQSAAQMQAAFTAAGAVAEIGPAMSLTNQATAVNGTVIAHHENRPSTNGRTNPMSPTINAVTLGVADLNRSKQFYLTGLGCKIEQDQPQFVSFALGQGSSALTLYPRRALAHDAGVDASGTGFAGITLNYFVETDERVDQVLTATAEAGGAVARPAQRAQWGGYFGYFSDPDGYLWKVVSTA